MIQKLYVRLKERLSKSEKENILRQIRSLERDLGLESERYNSSARNTTTAE